MLRRISRFLSLWLCASITGIITISAYLFFYSESEHSQILTSNGIHAPGANIVVSVKTGASEAAGRIPIQMRTSLRNVRNVVFFSDLEQDIGEYHLYDSLDTILPKVMKDSPDFVFYKKQRELWNATHDISSLKEMKHPEKSDMLAAWALDKPAMSGEAPWTLPFGPGTPYYWCRPALSLHHLSPEGMAEFTSFEDRRENKTITLTHQEIFDTFVLDTLVSERDNWDNMASEPGEFGETGGVSSLTTTFEECSQACEADERCFQYSHHGNTCNIGMSVRLGYKKEANKEGVWRSGWRKDRLIGWAKSQPKCGPASFPKQTT
ncbi:uncharacterized protein RCO7_08135 [Rhynchosporium graminicola]|uniref:Apple domain-containing protein n=1 Tax=Rhynchosporium graminicola TaxID=2792576 RepID=A0A1E1LDS2_9HELO|nr:uncharacterized protein RCO7_08135 [Rhynchosporium commune]